MMFRKYFPAYMKFIQASTLMMMIYEGKKYWNKRLSIKICDVCVNLENLEILILY